MIGIHQVQDRSQEFIQSLSTNDPNVESSDDSISDEVNYHLIHRRHHGGGGCC